MNKVILYIATSLDGFIADKEGGVDWLPHETEDPKDLVGFKALLNRISVIVMGSKSYKQILTFGQWAWPDKQTYVFTSQNLKTEQTCIEFVQNTPKNFIEKLKTDNQKGDIWLLGGAELIKSFAIEKLIDEVVITVIPTNLGEGIKLDLVWDNFIITSEKPCMDGIVQKVYMRK